MEPSWGNGTVGIGGWGSIIKHSILTDLLVFCVSDCSGSLRFPSFWLQNKPRKGTMGVGGSVGGGGCNIK